MASDPDHKAAVSDAEHVLMGPVTAQMENLARCYLNNREQLADARQTITRKVKDENERLRAEVSRLREALRWALDWDLDTAEPIPSDGLHRARSLLTGDNEGCFGRGRPGCKYDLEARCTVHETEGDNDGE